MVRDGYFYGLGFGVVAIAAWLTTHAFLLVAAPVLLAAFFLWFFRDPARVVPAEPGLIVSPADGKVTLIEVIETGLARQQRISIFLNVFNVHVNRAPIAGTIQAVNYKKGEFLNAMNPASAAKNEQNSVAIEGELCTVEFTQIAGLLARRIVFTKRLGEWVHRGERVGLIKFGSRVDVTFPMSCQVRVMLGDHVNGGSSILAVMPFGDLTDNAAVMTSESAQ